MRTSARKPQRQSRRGVELRTRFPALSSLFSVYFFPLGFPKFSKVQCPGNPARAYYPYFEEKNYCPRLNPK